MDFFPKYVKKYHLHLGVSCIPVLIIFLCFESLSRPGQRAEYLDQLPSPPRSRANTVETGHEWKSGVRRAQQASRPQIPRLTDNSGTPAGPEALYGQQKVARWFRTRMGDDPWLGLVESGPKMRDALPDSRFPAFCKLKWSSHGQASLSPSPARGLNLLRPFVQNGCRKCSLRPPPTVPRSESDTVAAFLFLLLR